jgi:hypothetical protein
MHLRWLSAGLAIATGLAGWLGLAGAASASIGVGVQANPVTLNGAAHPGGSYPLPSLYVVNTGTQAESMTVRVERLSPGPGRTIPPSWIRVDKLGGQLPPKQSARISLELVAPAGAAPGDYVSDIVVTGSTAPAAAGINFGAAAATRLEFRITPGPAPGSWLSLSAWTWWVTGGLVLTVAAIFGWRRSGLRIRVERRSAAGGAARVGGHHGT